jgi:hypothetical protein
VHVLQPGTHKLGCSGGNDIVLHLLGLPVVVPLEKSQWILEWTRIVSMLEDPIKYANIPKKGGERDHNETEVRNQPKKMQRREVS